MENKNSVFNENIKSKIEEIDQLCSVYGIPYFASFCLADNKDGTVYENYTYGSISNGIYLKDDQIRKHINVANGFYTVPPHASNEDIEGLADKMLAEMD